MIYDAGRAGTEKQRRAPCLEALVEDASKHDQAKIVFDLDDSLRSWDHQQMIELRRAAGVMDRIADEHRTRNSEGPPRAIRRLLAAYLDAVDRGADGTRIAGFFTDDGVFEGVGDRRTRPGGVAG